MENVFRSRSKRIEREVGGGEGVSGCCRIDPIHHRGIYIPAVATPRCPFPSRRPFFPDLPFLSIGRPQLASRGCFSLARTLMPPLFRGALARSLPFSLSLSLSLSLSPYRVTHPPSISNPPPISFLPSFLIRFTLATFLRRWPHGRRCNRPLSTRQISTMLVPTTISCRDDIFRFVHRYVSVPFV